MTGIDFNLFRSYGLSFNQAESHVCRPHRLRTGHGLAAAWSLCKRRSKSVAPGGGPGVRASAPRSPCGSTGARRPTGRRSHRTAFRSTRQRAAASTTRWASRACVALEATTSLAQSPAAGSVSVSGRGAAWPSGPGRRLPGGPWPIYRPPPASPPVPRRPASGSAPGPAVSSPAADAAARPCVIRCMA